MVLSTVPAEGHATVEAGFAAARADPQGSALFAGSSHRFWADILDRIPADYMLSSGSPFLIIQGGLDTSLAGGGGPRHGRPFSRRPANATSPTGSFLPLDHGMRSRMEPRTSPTLLQRSPDGLTGSATPAARC
jgi:hypothetical protein